MSTDDRGLDHGPPSASRWRRIRLAIAASILILIALWAYSGYQSVVHTGKFTEVRNQEFVRTDDEWVIKLDIVNLDRITQTYYIRMKINGENEPAQVIPVNAGMKYSYIYHVQRSRFPSGGVVATSTVVRDGDSEVIDESTFYLN